MAGTVEQKLAGLGIILQQPATPMANYVGFVRTVDAPPAAQSSHAHPAHASPVHDDSSQDAHGSHHPDSGTRSCCTGANSTDCSHHAAHGIGCAAHCAATGSALPATDSMPNPARPASGFDGLPLIGALAPAHVLLPLRPPA